LRQQKRFRVEYGASRQVLQPTAPQISMHVYEVRPRKDHRGVDLISDALPFGRLWYGEPDAVSNAYPLTLTAGHMMPFSPVIGCRNRNGIIATVVVANSCLIALNALKKRPSPVFYN
jgi:hypothetical protein